MTLPDHKPTRKQRFEAALKLAGLSVERWRTEIYPVSAQHLNEVWKGEANGGRRASAELNAAIDAVIAKYLGAAMTRRAGGGRGVGMHAN